MEAAHDSIRRARPLLGTFVEIAVAGAPVAAMEAAVEAAFAAVATVHRLMSFHEPDSDVSRLNRAGAAGPIRIHDWTYRVLETALDIHRRSAGVFDVAVAPALQRPGMQLLPGNQVRFAHHDVKIDLGGIAKGFAVDRAIETLRRHGMPESLVNAGGDVAAFGAHSHAIDIRDPRRPDRPMCQVALRDAALASSAGRFDPVRSGDVLAPAVVDPATAMPVRAVHGATVCATSCIIADALTKVVMNAGEAASPVLHHYGAHALFVSAQGCVHMTADWQNEVRFAA